jgi:hypothetical protein
MPDEPSIRLPRWYLSASVGFLAGVIGVSAIWEATERIALASGLVGAIVALALVELAVLWRPRR